MLLFLLVLKMILLGDVDLGFCGRVIHQLPSRWVMVWEWGSKDVKMVGKTELAATCVLK